MSNKIETNLSSCYLRFAGQKDVPLILEFIKTLAKYERMIDEVVATESLLEENLFGKEKRAEVILAYFDDFPAGFALFFPNFSTFTGQPGIHLEDLFVKEKYRGRGIGTTLLSYLSNLAVQRNCSRLEWAVLDWNTPSIKFYNSLNANILEDWQTFRLSGQSLINLSDQFKNGG